MYKYIYISRERGSVTSATTCSVYDHNHDDGTSVMAKLQHPHCICCILVPASSNDQPQGLHNSPWRNDHGVAQQPFCCTPHLLCLSHILTTYCHILSLSLSHVDNIRKPSSNCNSQINPQPRDDRTTKSSVVFTTAQLGHPAFVDGILGCLAPKDGCDPSPRVMTSPLKHSIWRWRQGQSYMDCGLKTSAK